MITANTKMGNTTAIATTALEGIVEGVTIRADVMMTLEGETVLEAFISWTAGEDDPDDNGPITALNSLLHLDALQLQIFMLSVNCSSV
jgi:hypothetical protein